MTNVLHPYDLLCEILSDPGLLYHLHVEMTTDFYDEDNSWGRTYNYLQAEYEKRFPEIRPAIKTLPKYIADSFASEQLSQFLAEDLLDLAYFASPDRLIKYPPLSCGLTVCSRYIEVINYVIKKLNYPVIPIEGKAVDLYRNRNTYKLYLGGSNAPIN